LEKLLLSHKDPFIHPTFIGINLTLNVNTILVVGHYIDNYNVFKYKIIHLIRRDWITFDRSCNTPNMNTNPLPNHVAIWE
jgi:hypothetical protein